MLTWRTLSVHYPWLYPHQVRGYITSVFETAFLYNLRIKYLFVEASGSVFCFSVITCTETGSKSLHCKLSLFVLWWKGKSLNIPLIKSWMNLVCIFLLHINYLVQPGIKSCILQLCLLTSTGTVSYDEAFSIFLYTPINTHFVSVSTVLCIFILSLLYPVIINTASSLLMSNRGRI